MTAQGLKDIIKGDPLTDREIEVLYGAASGETSPKTGERIFLSPDTVKEYKKKSIAKLDAKNITHAVVIALSVGILDISKIVDDELE